METVHLFRGVVNSCLYYVELGGFVNIPLRRGIDGRGHFYGCTKN